MTSNKGMITFIIVWAGQLVSTLGSALTNFALGVWVYETTGSATQFSLTLLASAIAYVALSPLAGVVSDRWDRRLVMLLSDTGAGFSSAFIFAMLLMGRLQVWHIYLASFLNSAFSAFQWPAYSAATSLLVPKKHLGRAGGMTQIGQAISQLVAPAIAGALFVTAGLTTVLMIDVATYLVALGTLLVVRFPKPEATEEGRAARGPWWREAAFGWTYIRARAGLFGLLIVFAIVNFFVNITFALYTPLILGMTTPDVLGYLNGVGGLGMLVGTLLMSTWGGPQRRIWGIYVAETVLGVTTLLFGLRLSIPMMAVNNFFFMVAMPISSGCSQAIWQTKVAPDIQGRVFATRRMLAYSVIPLAYAMAGPLAERIFEPGMAEGGAMVPLFGRLIGTGPGHGIALIFFIGGAIYSLIVLTIVLHPRIRRVELELPDAIAQIGRDPDA
ncbi:MAG: MFS transporter [Anaerolineae bacterium]|nr:MFS transporter [Anaerolineae bacterium]